VSVPVSEVSVLLKRVYEWSDATESLLLVSIHVVRLGDLLLSISIFFMLIDLTLVAISLIDASVEIMEIGVDYFALVE